MKSLSSLFPRYWRWYERFILRPSTKQQRMMSSSMLAAGGWRGQQSRGSRDSVILEGQAHLGNNDENIFFLNLPTNADKIINSRIKFVCGRDVQTNSQSYKKNGWMLKFSRKVWRYKKIINYFIGLLGVNFDSDDFQQVTAIYHNLGLSKHTKI